MTTINFPKEDALIDRGVDDILDEGYSPPEKWKEPRHHESLDELLSEEQPDPAMQIGDDDDLGSDFSQDEVGGDRRAGRLVAPDEGVDEDEKSDLLARRRYRRERRLGRRGGRPHHRRRGVARPPMGSGRRDQIANIVE
jgi:hypothetical protein